MFNLFKTAKSFIDFDKLESGTQSIVINLLELIEKNHLEIGRLLTFGTKTDQEIERLHIEIINAVKMLHPIANIAHALIPESMTHLHKWMDFAIEIYDKIIDKK